MRYYLILFLFAFMAVYAWRDWYKSLCFLVVSMSILERPDMPQSMFGVVGLSPWNLLFVSIFSSFFVNYKRKNNEIKLPRHITYFLIFYLVVIIIGFFRAAIDLNGINAFREYLTTFYRQSFFPNITFRDIFFDDILNSLKYALPAILFYYGANNKKDIIYGLLAVTTLGLLLALQVIKVMPISSLVDGYTLEQTAIRKLDRDIGYYRSDLAIIFGGIGWSLFLIRSIFKSRLLNISFLFFSFLTALALALTGGRIGMGSWLVVGSVIAFFRMRILFFIVPLLVFLIVSLVPAVHDRFFQGIEQDDSAIEEADYSAATSGRAIIWPYVIEKIAQAPMFGYGRRSMQRIGLSESLGRELHMPFPSPHNAYLELLLDNGFLLSAPIFLFYFLLLKYSFKLFRENKNDVSSVVGGISFSMITGHLVGYIGLQSFYPMASTVSMWVSVAIMLRIYFDKSALDILKNTKAVYNELPTKAGKNSHAIKQHYK